MLTLPACAQTIAGPSPSRSAAASGPGCIAPLASTGIRVAPAEPKPSNRSAFSSETWASSPTRMRTGGAPLSPSSSTSQPALASTRWRPEASPTRFAIVAPVTKPTRASRGSPSASSSQRAVTSSTAAPAGETTRPKCGPSQVETSQSAATVTGSAPPVTKPK